MAAPLAAVLGVLATTAAFVPTPLPAKPKENARVIVAPCSPLLAAQQRWGWPAPPSAVPVTLLSAPGMALHLLTVPQASRHDVVVRTAAPGATGDQAPARWHLNESLSVLHLAPGAGAPAGWTSTGTNNCLRYDQNGQFSALAVGDCATASWSSSTADLPAGAGLSSLLRNETDSTIRFVFRDAYNINAKNFSVCMTATWGEPCEPPEFAKLPFCDVARGVDERLEDLLSRTSVEEKVSMLSNDDANRPWISRLSVNPNNTHQEALHGADASGGAAAASHTTPGSEGQATRSFGNLGCVFQRLATIVRTGRGSGPPFPTLLRSPPASTDRSGRGSAGQSGWRAGRCRTKAWVGSTSGARTSTCADTYSY